MIYYGFIASSRLSLGLIINYLDKYPLFSIRYLEYKDWNKIVLLILKNKHYTEQGINEAEYVINGINRKRTLRLLKLTITIKIYILLLYYLIIKTLNRECR